MIKKTLTTHANLFYKASLLSLVKLQYLVWMLTEIAIIICVSGAYREKPSFQHAVLLLLEQTNLKMWKKRTKLL